MRKMNRTYLGLWSSLISTLLVLTPLAAEQKKAFNVKAGTSGGPIFAENIKGEVVLNTSGGSITLENIDGVSRARTSGGGIKATNCQGDTELRTSGGSIRITSI